MSYVIGPSTYIAGVDLQPFTIVKVDTTLSGITPKVIPAVYTLPVVGMVQTGVAAGEVCSVYPFSSDGYYRVRYTIFNGCDVGDQLFLGADGTVTDVFTGGQEVGRALQKMTLDDYSDMIYLDITGAGGFSRAQDVIYENTSGAYDSPYDVQNALDQIGAYLTVSQIERHDVFSGRILSEPVGASTGGGAGALTSEFLSRFYLSQITPGLLGYEGQYRGYVNPFNGTVSGTAVNFYTDTPRNIIVDADNPIDVSILYLIAEDDNYPTPAATVGGGLSYLSTIGYENTSALESASIYGTYGYPIEDFPWLPITDSNLSKPGEFMHVAVQANQDGQTQNSLYIFAYQLYFYTQVPTL